MSGARAPSPAYSLNTLAGDEEYEFNGILKIDISQAESGQISHSEESQSGDMNEEEQQEDKSRCSSMIMTVWRFIRLLINCNRE